MMRRYVALDGLPGLMWPADLTDDHWNGWETPAFAPSVFQSVYAALDGVDGNSYRALYDTEKQQMYSRRRIDGEVVTEVLPLNERGRLQFPAGYLWRAVATTGPTAPAAHHRTHRTTTTYSR